jgi:hypothetical protein
MLAATSDLIVVTDGWKNSSQCCRGLGTTPCLQLQMQSEVMKESNKVSAASKQRWKVDVQGTDLK